MRQEQTIKMHIKDNRPGADKLPEKGKGYERIYERVKKRKRSGCLQD